MASGKSNLQDFANPGIQKGMVCGMTEFIDCILQRARIVKIDIKKECESFMIIKKFLYLRAGY